MGSKDWNGFLSWNAGVTADLDPSRIWTPFADLDPPTKLSF